MTTEKEAKVWSALEEAFVRRYLEEHSIQFPFSLTITRILTDAYNKAWIDRGYYESSTKKGKKR